MAEVVRPIDPDTERGVYMPARELLEPEASDVNLAMCRYMAQIIAAGTRDAAGEMLVCAGEFEVTVPYSLSISEE